MNVRRFLAQTMEPVIIHWAPLSACVRVDGKGPHVMKKVNLQSGIRVLSALVDLEGVAP